MRKILPFIVDIIEMCSHSGTYPASVMKYRELGLVLQLLWFGKFDMVPLCV